MNCPACGYARSAFDTHCPRCRQMAASGQRRIFNPAEQTVIVPELSADFRDTSRGLNAWAVSLLVLLSLGVGVYIGRLTAPQPPVVPNEPFRLSTVSVERYPTFSPPATKSP